MSATTRQAHDVFYPSIGDEVFIIIEGRGLTGWQEISITRGAEQVPSSFDLLATERFPQISSDKNEQSINTSIVAGVLCQIKIGADLVLTGYVDQVMPTLTASGHSIRVQGRSKLEDIVDCSVTEQAILGLQVQTTNLLSLAELICFPFGISVKSLTGDSVPVSSHGGGPLAFSASLQDTGYEIIEQVARYANVLVYDDTNGNMILARAGAFTMASGFELGVNVQEATITYAMDERYSDYIPRYISYEFFNSDGTPQESDPGSFPAVKDKGVQALGRYRPLVIISEQFGADGPLAVQRAKWEMARRFGRSQAVKITCDSWRDRDGNLWQPNAFAPFDLPALNLPRQKEPWVISQVTFNRDAQRGTTAEVTMMPKDAFTQEPVILQPFLGNWDNGSIPGAGT